MISRQRMLFVAGLALVVSVSWFALAPSRAADDSKSDAKADTRPKPSARKIAMKEFMRKKLEASQNVIEGLALEDFELIEKGARQLKATSAAAEFMVVNDPLYKDHADEFRRTVTKMEKAAKEKRIDGATLGFVDMTMNCVECHKFVRTILIAGQ